MTKQLLIAFISACAVLGGAAAAQPVPAAEAVSAAASTAAAAAPASAAASGPAPEPSERARIAAERQAAQNRFAAEEKACYNKFATQHCLTEAATRRRLAMSDLRRQEVSLNDADRKRRGAEQMKRLEKKQESEAAKQER